MNKPQIITRDIETDLILATKLMHWVLVDDSEKKSEIAQIWCCVKNGEVVLVGYPYGAYNVGRDDRDKLIYDHMWSVWSPSSDPIDLFKAESTLRYHETLLIPDYVRHLCEICHVDLTHNGTGSDVKLARYFLILNATPAEKAIALKRTILQQKE